MRLSAEVSAQDVQEALRLFKVSTMAAASAGSTAGDLGSLRPETQQEVRRAEDFLKRRIAVRSTVNRKKVRVRAGRTLHVDTGGGGEEDGLSPTADKLVCQIVKHLRDFEL